MERKRCPACDSSQVHIRIKTQEIVCNQCGTVTKLANHA